jgi:TonB family protein
MRTVLYALAAVFVCATAAQAQMRKIYDLPPVAYPDACLEKRIEGTVVLRFHVEPNGKIQDIAVTKAVPECPQMTAAALEAVKHATVYPLPPGTRLLHQSVEVPVKFSISQSEL